jgi:hypothetical protein
MSIRVALRSPAARRKLTRKWKGRIEKRKRKKGKERERKGNTEAQFPTP